MLIYLTSYIRYKLIDVTSVKSYMTVLWLYLIKVMYTEYTHIPLAKLKTNL